MPPPTLEERVAALETEVGQLKRQKAETTSQNAAPSWRKVVGVFKDDPEFEEAMRLGREYRESLRPKDDEDAA